MSEPNPEPRDWRRRTFIVVPAFNESACIGETVRQLRAEYPNVIVLDDGSTDDTAAHARAAGAVVVRHLLNRGQGAAIQTGVEFALSRGAEFVVTFDADGQHRCEDIAALVRPIARGECDVALGSRFLGEAVGMPVYRRMILRAAVLFSRVAHQLPVTDAHDGLRCFSRRAAGLLRLKMDGMAHASEILDVIRRERLRFLEAPVRIRYTEYSLARPRTLRHAVHILFHYFVGRVSR